MIRNKKAINQNTENQETRVKLVSPSTEPVDASELLDYATELINAGADFLHCDIMDGVAVTKRTYDAKALLPVRNGLPTFKLDVHLMVDDNEEFVKRFLRLRPYAITVQYDFFEYEKELLNCLKMIKRTKTKAGISISPKTPIAYITPFLKYIDLVLVMGVKPGLGGQELIPETLAKVRELKHIKNVLKKDLLISFDGGVTLKNAQKIYDAGADILVSGNAIYNSFDRAYAIDSLKNGEPLFI